MASNIDAINSVMAYCRAALGELESMKLLPAVDASKIEELKKGIPRIDVFTESTGEKSMEKVPPTLIPRFGGAASDEYEQTLLDRVHKKAKDFLSKPAMPNGDTDAGEKEGRTRRALDRTRYTGARK